MQFASALSREVQTEAAVSAVLEQVAPQLEEQHAHLGFVFASPHHLKAFPRLLHVMQERFATHTLIGCTGGGVEPLATAEKFKIDRLWPSWVAHLPGVDLSSASTLSSPI